MKRILLILIIGSLVSGCYYDNASEMHPGAGLNLNCDTTNVTFNNTIAPILNSNCGTNNSCHSSSQASGIVVLDNYASALLVDEITLIDCIEQTSTPVMPPSGKLSDCNINLIKIWIQTGKPQ